MVLSLHICGFEFVKICVSGVADPLPKTRLTGFAKAMKTIILCMTHNLRVVPTPPPWLLGSHISTCCLQQKHAEHHDSVVYSKHELTLTFLAGATSDLTVGNTTQEPLEPDFYSRYFFIHTLPSCDIEFLQQPSG